MKQSKLNKLSHPIGSYHTQGTMQSTSFQFSWGLPVWAQHTQTQLYLIPDSFSSLWVYMQESWVESITCFANFAWGNFFSENSLNQNVMRDHLGNCLWLIMWLSQGMFCRWNYPERIFCNNNWCNYIATFCMFYMRKVANFVERNCCINYAAV